MLRREEQQATMSFDFHIKTKQDLIDAVDAFGILPYFATSIPGFSLEEHCSPAVLFSDTGEDTWAWKGPVIRATGCAYGKFFEKKAAYVSREVFLDLANYRRGWGVAQYSTPERTMGEAFTAHVYDREPAESYERLLDRLRALFPHTEEKALKRFLK